MHAMATKADSHVAGWFKAKTLAEKFLKALNHGALSFKDEIFERKVMGTGMFLCFLKGKMQVCNSHFL
jgi:hypothetical protein